LKDQVLDFRWNGLQQERIPLVDPCDGIVDGNLHLHPLIRL
jgi:hypothetical protein